MIDSAVDRYLASTVGRFAAAVLALVGTVLHTVGIPGLQQIPPYRIDLDVYRVGGQVFRDGGELYGQLPLLVRGDVLPFTYPPLAAQIFALFTLVPLEVASVFITLATIAVLAYAVQLVLTRTCGRTNSELWWITLAVMAVALWFGPVRETIGFGQVNVFLMALVLVDVIRGRERWWGGSLTGLAMAIKLTPAVFLLFFALRRDWRGLGTAVVAALAFTGIGHLLAPVDSVRYWSFAIRDPARIGGLSFSSNQSVNGFVHRLGFEDTAASVVWFVVSAVVGLGIAWVAWRLLRYGHELAAAVVVGFVALFCSPVSWGHHWVWAVPAVVLTVVWAARAVERGDDDERGWLALAGTGVVIFLTTPQWWFPHDEGRELAWGPVEHLVGDAYLVWGLAFLVLVGVRAARLSSPELHGHPEKPALLVRSGSR
ncbi:MAG: glycosyltransferase 87 family protein [Dietzia sp.]